MNVESVLAGALLEGTEVLMDNRVQTVTGIQVDPGNDGWVRFTTDQIPRGSSYSLAAHHAVYMVCEPQVPKGVRAIEMEDMVLVLSVSKAGLMQMNSNIDASNTIDTLRKALKCYENALEDQQAAETAAAQHCGGCAECLQPAPGEHQAAADGVQG